MPSNYHQFEHSSWIRMLILAAAFILPSCNRSSEEVVRIVGSSTVYPFSRTVSERFSVKSGISAPVIEVTGTGAGFKRFCSGPGAADISNASRRMKQSEFELCRKNSVFPVMEFMIGYDGIVAAISPENPLSSLTLDQLYLGLARDIPSENGGFIANPYQRWNEIDPSLPDLPILVHGPPPTSGTRDAFVELAMHGGAQMVPSLSALKGDDKAAFNARAGAIREDGRWIDEGENDNAIIQIIRQSDHAIGVFGFSFFEQNQDLVEGLALSDVDPSFSTIADRSYPLARSLFFYSHVETAQTRDDVREYIQEFLSEAAIGELGYLIEKGLIPLAQEKREEQRSKATTLAAWPGPIAGEH